MAQRHARAADALDKVDPVWARIRSEAEEAVRREPELATFIYSTILHHDTLEAAVVHRVSQRLDHPDVPAELIRQAYEEALESDPSIGVVVPRRHRRDLRPRSGDPPLPRAGALLQGLPRDADASAGALALAQGPQGFRLLPAEPLVGGVPDRHPSGGADRPRHLPRPRHRPGGRRDRGDRGRRLDPARRDARRHRQGIRATAIRRSAAA